MRDRRRTVLLALARAATCLALVALALAAAPAPAHAFGSWAHDDAQGCVCHDAGTPTDATCTSCHTGFASYPGQACWSCHAPGQDTSALASPSSACSQECHLWNSVQKAYVTPVTHGANPHLGSSAGCVTCHSVSPEVDVPGSSPHHSGQATGFSACRSCHSDLQQHAGKVECTKCHGTAVAFHLFAADSPGTKSCRGCHAKKHDGRKVPGSTCSKCHKGTGVAPSQAQHAASISKKRVCGACHKQKLHARSFSSAITSCRSCHGGKFHARQKKPASSVCLRCHTAARHHADGFRCSICHRRAIHNPRPGA